MSHLSKIIGTKLTNLTALRAAVELAAQKRSLKLELEVSPGLAIRGWRGAIQNKQYTAIIRCLSLNADIGLAFIPDTGLPAGTEPIVMNNVVQNGYFTLEADLMMLHELGPKLNLITNLYSATVIQSVLGDRQNNSFDLNEDNSIVIQSVTA